MRHDKLNPSPPDVSEGGEESSISQAFAAPYDERAGTTRATSSIIRSGQKDTEASILCVMLAVLALTRGGINKPLPVGQRMGQNILRGVVLTVFNVFTLSA